MDHETCDSSNETWSAADEMTQARAQADGKAPRRSLRSAGHNALDCKGFQGELSGAFKFGSNSLAADPETLSVSASFIVSAKGL